MGASKAGDSRGKMIEMSQMAGDKMLQVVADLWNAVLSGKRLPPEYWRETRINT